jgi:hypothetical protein
MTTTTILETQTIPSSLTVLRGTQVQRCGEYLKICDLGNLITLVALGTARTVKFFVMHPATGLIDQCRMEHVYTAKRSTFCGRHIEHAIEYGTREARMSSFGVKYC